MNVGFHRYLVTKGIKKGSPLFRALWLHVPGREAGRQGTRNQRQNQKNCEIEEVAYVGNSKAEKGKDKK